LDATTDRPGPDEQFSFLQAYISRKHEDDKVIVCERNNVIFVFNFHPTKSYVDYKIGIQVDGTYPFCSLKYLLKYFYTI